MSLRFVTGRGALQVSTMPGTANEGPQASPLSITGHVGLAGAVVDIGVAGDKSFIIGATEAEVADEAGNAIGITLDIELRIEADPAEAV